MTRPSIPFLFLLFLASLGGCDDDDDGSSFSGVPADKSMASIGPSEANQLCQWYLDLLGSSTYAKSMCHRMAVDRAFSSDSQTDGELQANCRAAEAECNSEIGSEFSDSVEECASTFDELTCNAPVNDFETCARAIANLSTDAGLPACDKVSLAAPVSEESASGLDIPDACNAFVTTCPEFTSETNDSSSSTDDPLVAACLEVCQRTVDECGAPDECATDCLIQKQMSGTGCSSIATQYFECMKTGALSCNPDGFLESLGSDCDRNDASLCQLLGGEICSADSTIDELCTEIQGAAYPMGIQCVSTAPIPTSCVAYAAGLYCCPAGTAL